MRSLKAAVLASLVAGFAFFGLGILAAQPIQLTSNSTSDTDPVVSADGRKIAFVSDRDGDMDIFIMNVDGTGQTKLTSNNSNDTSPSISGDGRRVVWESAQANDADIFIWTNGSSPVRLFGSPRNGEDIQPSISSDGSTVAFVSNGDPLGLNPTGDFEIFLIRADGTGLFQLTQNASDDFAPSVSGNSGKIAFQTRIAGFYDIQTVNSDGSGLTRLTNSTGDDVAPSISADGTSIAFISNGPAIEAVGPEPESFPVPNVQPSGPAPFAVYVIDSTGASLRQVSGTSGDSLGPSISGDGTRVAYYSGGSNAEVYLVDSDGTGLIQVTNNTVVDAAPSLDQTGETVVFMSSLGGDFEIYAANLQLPCSLMGDVNSDGVVNISDLAAVGVAFGTMLGGPGYDPRADLNNDGVINIEDLATVGQNFGTAC